jgi:hypothetical protein
MKRYPFVVRPLETQDSFRQAFFSALADLGPDAALLTGQYRVLIDEALYIAIGKPPRLGGLPLKIGDMGARVAFLEDVHADYDVACIHEVLA